MSARYVSAKVRRKQERKQKTELLEEMRQWVADPLDVVSLRELLQESLRGFAVEAGTRVALCLLQDEVLQLCGPEYQRLPGRELSRYGRQPGVVMLAGRGVPILKPRVRYKDGRGEKTLDTYEQLQRPEALTQSTLAKMVRGVSCRNYEEVLDTARVSLGVQKSNVSRGFVKASRKELDKLLTRPLPKTRMVALFLDGIDFAGEMLIVALVLDSSGNKPILGLRQGTTENAIVCRELLTSLRDRGLDTSQPMLCVLDGSKALDSAVREVFDGNVLIQRCQVHKKRNVKAHLPESLHEELDQRLNVAYYGDDYAAAKKQLDNTMKWLERLNPSAAASLREGLDETLTVIRLGLTDCLRRTLATTNPIESVMDTTRTITGRVKHWQDGAMRQRWCASGLLKAEQRFRRVKGYKDIPKLIEALDAALAKSASDSTTNPKTKPKSNSK